MNEIVKSLIVKTLTVTVYVLVLYLAYSQVLQPALRLPPLTFVETAVIVFFVQALVPTARMPSGK